MALDYDHRGSVGKLVLQTTSVLFLIPSDFRMRRSQLPLPSQQYRNGNFLDRGRTAIRPRENAT